MNNTDKIIKKADALRLRASMDYDGQGPSSVPYKETIVSNDKYPGFYFLVNESMIFNGGALSDSEYQVFSFNQEGEYIRKENVAELGKDFFRTNKIVKKIVE